MKSVIDRVNEVVKQEQNPATDLMVQINKCMNFIKKMEDKGAIHLDTESITPVSEGGLDQLKLYSLHKF